MADFRKLTEQDERFFSGLVKSVMKKHNIDIHKARVYVLSELEEKGWFKR